MTAKSTKRRSQQDKRLAKLRRMPDSEIDFSDIPETDANFWADAKLVEHPKKVPISIRVDEDVLQWFKENTKTYQREMNAVLRTYVLHKNKAA